MEDYRVYAYTCWDEFVAYCKDRCRSGNYPYREKVPSGESYEQYAQSLDVTSVDIRFGRGGYITTTLHTTDGSTDTMYSWGGVSARAQKVRQYLRKKYPSFSKVKLYDQRMTVNPPTPSVKERADTQAANWGIAKGYSNRTVIMRTTVVVEKSWSGECNSAQEAKDLALQASCSKGSVWKVTADVDPSKVEVTVEPQEQA